MGLCPGAKRIPIDQAVSIPKINGAATFLARCQTAARANGTDPSHPTTGKADAPSNITSVANAVPVHVKSKWTTPRKTLLRGPRARIRGAELPDEWIVLGNHRDAWVSAASIPRAASASMMELTAHLEN